MTILSVPLSMIYVKWNQVSQLIVASELTITFSLDESALVKQAWIYLPPIFNQMAGFLG